MDEPALHERRWWALAVLCLSLVVIVLDNTILNVALPALVRDVHASTSQLQWIVDSYTLVFAGLLLTCGSIGDRFGRKGSLAVGLGIFGLGSALSALSGSANVLILTRASMGVGAALIMPATLSLLTNIFRDPKERGRAIGVWAAVAGAGGAIGPVLGGLLLRHFWWGSVFLINVPVTVVAIIAGRVLLPSSRNPNAPRLDLGGSALSIAGLVALLWAIIQGPVKGWGNGTVLASFGAGMVLVGAFLGWELRSDHPMLNLRFFQNRRFSAASAGITMVFFAMFGSMFLITQYLQSVLGYTALQAGFRMLPMAVVMLIVAPLAPRIVERVGTKLVMGGGLLLATSGLLWASSVPVSNGYPHLFLAMALLSGGMGLVMAPATESIMGSLPPAQAGVGSAMNDTTRQMGGALGVAVLGSALASSYRPGIATRLNDLGAPGDLVAKARDSVGGALQAAADVRLSPAVRTAAASAARTEFVRAFGGAVIVAAVVVATAAIIVFAFLPARAHHPREHMETATDGIASLAAAEAESVLEEDAAGYVFEGVGESRATPLTEDTGSSSADPLRS